MSGEPDCGSSYDFYNCTIVVGSLSNYVGCCTTNACNSSQGCPEADQVPTIVIDPSSSAAALSTIDSGTGALPTHTVFVTTGTSTSIKTVLITETTTPTTSSSTLSSSSTSTLQPATTSPVLNHVSMSLSSSSQSPTQTAAPSIVTSHSNNTQIIAGSAAGGAVALAFLSILVWFCFRRHQRKKRDVENVRDSIAKYGLPTRDYVLERAQTDESMRSKNSDIFAQFGGRYTTPQLSHSVTVPNQENQKSIGAAIIRSHSAERVLDSPTDENAPLPDFEKSSVTPPPVHEHPAFHPLPGDTEMTQVSTYQPEGQPIYSASSSMSQHPAYHLSKLNQHPAFRSSSSSSSDPRKEAYMRREAGSMLSEIPVPFSPAFSSPLPGFTELPAEVPASYRTSSPPAEVAGSWPLPNTKPISGNGNRNGNSNVPVPLPLPQFKVHNPSSSSTSDDGYQIKSVNVPRPNSTGKQKQDQFQSYDGAYDYDDVDLVSPVGSSRNGRWSGSTIGELDRLDVMVGDKREVDELTPLSQVYRESWSERGSWCQR